MKKLSLNLLLLAATSPTSRAPMSLNLDKTKGTVDLKFTYLKEVDGEWVMPTYPPIKYVGAIVSGNGNNFTILGIEDVNDRYDEVNNPWAQDLYPCLFSGTISSEGIVDLYKTIPSEGGNSLDPEDVEHVWSNQLNVAFYTVAQKTTAYVFSDAGGSIAEDETF